jgi:multidrug efflux pump subunit AcrB
MQGNYDIAQRIANRLRQIPGTADVHVQQMLSLPTLHLDMDRTRINQVGLTAQNVAQSVLISLSGSFQTAPNFWLNPKNGVTYSIAIQTPQYHDVAAGPDEYAGDRHERQAPQVLGNLVQVTPVRRGPPWSIITTCSRSSTCMPARRGAIWAESRRTS